MLSLLLFLSSTLLHPGVWRWRNGWGCASKIKKLVAVSFGHRLLECLITTWVHYVVAQLIPPNDCPWGKGLSILLYHVLTTKRETTKCCKTKRTPMRWKHRAHKEGEMLSGLTACAAGGHSGALTTDLFRLNEGTKNRLKRKDLSEPTCRQGWRWKEYTKTAPSSSINRARDCQYLVHLPLNTFTLSSQLNP